MGEGMISEIANRRRQYGVRKDEVLETSGEEKHRERDAQRSAVCSSCCGSCSAGDRGTSLTLYSQ